MATIQIGQFASGAVTFQADYHDGNLRVTAVRCINTGTGNARVTLIDPDTRVVAAQTTFLPGTTVINIPQGRTVTVDPERGVVIPYEVRLEYPVP